MASWRDGAQSLMIGRLVTSGVASSTALATERFRCFVSLVQRFIEACFSKYSLVTRPMGKTLHHCRLDVTPSSFRLSRLMKRVKIGFACTTICYYVVTNVY